MSHRSHATDAPRPARALVRDMTGGPTSAVAPAPEVILEARPAVDFLVSLMLDTESEMLPADRAWYEESRASLSDALKHDFARVLGDGGEGKGLGGAIVPLVIEDRTVRSAADVASRLLRRHLPFNRKLAEQVLAVGWTCRTEKARRLLGFEARTTLRDSIDRSALWYREKGWI